MPITRHLFAASLLALALAACRPGAAPAPHDAAVPAPAPDAAAGPASAPAPEPVADACPDADFDAFLARFSASADAQRAATADPLAMVSIDGNAQPEPAPVTREVPLAEVRFPVLVDAAQQRAEGLAQSVTVLAPDRRELRLALPDSGVQTRLEFQAAPCWTLVKVSDDTF